MLHSLSFLTARFRWALHRRYAWQRYAKDARQNHRRAREQFRLRHGYPLDLECPATHSERVYLRKLADHDPRFSLLCDKLAVRGFIDNVLGAGMADQLCVPVIAQADSFDALPDSVWQQDVILKCTHGSGMNHVVRANDAAARRRARKKIKFWLGRVHGARRFERAYFDLVPSVIAEPLLQAANLTDAKLYYYDGHLWHIMMEDNTGRLPTVGIYGPDWTYQDYKFPRFPSAEPVARPAMLDDMQNIATRLAQGFDAIRVDFLLTPDRFYLGEITVYDGSGLGAFQNKQSDRAFAAHWKQPHLGVDRTEPTVDDGVRISA